MNERFQIKKFFLPRQKKKHKPKRKAEENNVKENRKAVNESMKSENVILSMILKMRAYKTICCFSLANTIIIISFNTERTECTEWNEKKRKKEAATDSFFLQPNKNE
jgi:hypothetical protein